MLAAEATFRVLNKYSRMEIYWDNLKNIWEELYGARNYRPVSKATHCLVLLQYLTYSFQTLFF